jgi:hypothetical protein
MLILYYTYVKIVKEKIGSRKILAEGIRREMVRAFAASTEDPVMIMETAQRFLRLWVYRSMATWTHGPID